MLFLLLFPSYAVSSRDADERLHDRRVPHVDLYHCRDIHNLRSRREKVRAFMRMSNFEFHHQFAYVDIESHHRKTIQAKQVYLQPYNIVYAIYYNYHELNSLF